MARTPLLRRLARPSGGFAMMAIDQRESLTTTFEAATGERAGDQALALLEVAAARVLSPDASAILLTAPAPR